MHARNLPRDTGFAGGHTADPVDTGNRLDSVEIELKFQIPRGERSGVRRALATRTARSLRLRAHYFDTPDRRLATAGLSLRLRQEGRRWVQTLKGRGDGHLSRLEHEVPLDGRPGVPAIDIARHAGTPAGEALAAALGRDAPALAPVFETDVRRTCRTVRSAGASVEIALDVGELRAGAARLALFEIEFELVRGPVAGLLALAGRWALRHALWLDVRSKAERGDRLARAVNAGAPVGATAPRLSADMPADAALRAMIAAGLAQVLPNAAELAAGAGGAEHLHQLRVGIRRLRTALREFGGGSVDVDTTWEPALAGMLAQLGAARDRDVLAALLPRLRAAGAPYTELPLDADRELAGAALRSAAWCRLVLDLIGFVHGIDAAGAGHAGVRPPPLSTFVRPRLQRLQRLIERDAARLRTLDDERRHRTRKRLKRLRYATDFVAALYPAKDLRRYLARLRPAQLALGEYNDSVVAERAFASQLAEHAGAWFAIGWLRAQRATILERAVRALDRLSKVRRPW